MRAPDVPPITVPCPIPKRASSAHPETTTASKIKPTNFFINSSLCTIKKTKAHFYKKASPASGDRISVLAEVRSPPMDFYAFELGRVRMPICSFLPTDRSEEHT